MDAMEAVAIIILIIAIVILVYYYLLNSPETMEKIKNVVPESADAHMDEVLGKNSKPAYDLAKEDVGDAEKGDSESMSKRIKVKLSDNMSGLNTDAFSHKIDAFLDAKSDELIKDWSLATTKFSETTANVDNLEKNFEEFKKSSAEFQKVTEERLGDLDKRIESLENK